MARSYKFNPLRMRKEREQYMRYERRYSAQKKGVPNPQIKVLEKIWSEDETPQEVAEREWQHFLEREVYGYY